MSRKQTGMALHSGGLRDDTKSGKVRKDSGVALGLSAKTALTPASVPRLGGNQRQMQRDREAQTKPGRVRESPEHDHCGEVRNDGALRFPCGEGPGIVRGRSRVGPGWVRGGPGGVGPGWARGAAGVRPRRGRGSSGFRPVYAWRTSRVPPGCVRDTSRERPGIVRGGTRNTPEWDRRWIPDDAC
eukprot:gene15173-biopygen4092